MFTQLLTNWQCISKFYSIDDRFHFTVWKRLADLQYDGESLQLHSCMPAAASSPSHCHPLRTPLFLSTRSQPSVTATTTVSVSLSASVSMTLSITSSLSPTLSVAASSSVSASITASSTPSTSATRSKTLTLSVSEAASAMHSARTPWRRTPPQKSRHFLPPFLPRRHFGVGHRLAEQKPFAGVNLIHQQLDHRIAVIQHECKR